MSDAEIAAVLSAPPPAPPTTPAEASTRLNQVRSGADPKWNEAFLAGNPARVQEFHDWHELAAKGDDIDRAMAGMYQEGSNTSDHILQMGAAGMLQEMGIRPEIVRDVITSKHTVTQAEYDATKLFKADRMTDPEFVKRYLAGDHEAKRKMMLADIILTGGIKDSQ
jgi:hypothetical protein